jgi:ribonuclease HII
MSADGLIAGIDEAGRGPVLGSMFIGGVAVTEDQLEELKEIGLKDSKKLSDTRREDLGTELRDIVTAVVVREVTASEIDELSEIMSLNEIEIRAFADVLTDLGVKEAYIDLPEPDGERFGRKVTAEMPDEADHPAITAEHGADDTYPVVSAASIAAKNAREDHVAELAEKYDRDIGSGYPHDSPTTQFLEDHYKEHGNLPAETRRSWSTARQIIEKDRQKGLGDF